MKGAGRGIPGVGTTWQESVRGKSLCWSESMKERFLDAGGYQRDEHCKMWLKKRDLSNVLEDHIFF